MYLVLEREGNSSEYFREDTLEGATDLAQIEYLLPIEDHSNFLLEVMRFEELTISEQYDLKRQIAFLHSKIENLEHENKKLTADNRFLFMARNKYLGDVCDLEAEKERLEELLQERSATTPSYIPAGAFQHYNGLD